MKRRTIPFLMVCVLLLAVAVSCNSNPGGGGGGSDVPKRTPELKLNNFKQYYPVGAQKSDLSGDLYYYSEDGKIETLSVKSEGVEIKGWDSSAVAENKTIKFTYKNIDCVATYSIVKKAEVYLDGTVIFDKNTTYTFEEGSDKVTKEVYKSWYDFCNCGVEGAAEPVQSELTYTVDINTSGATIIRFEGDSWPYRPDGNGGINGKPSFEDYFDNNAPQPYFYVSTKAAENDHVTNPAARGKYLVMAFDFDGNMYMWFTDDTEKKTLEALNVGEAIKLEGTKIDFDSVGVFFKNADAGDKAKNLRLLLNKDGYASSERAFTIISSSDTIGETKYYGYSYTMKLTDIGPSWN